MYWFENFEIKNTTSASPSGALYTVSGGFGHVFVNCSFHDCGNNGLWTQSATAITFFRCCSYSNGNNGMYIGPNTNLLYCSIHDNANGGMILSGAGINIIGCLIYKNAGTGLSIVPAGTLILNCVLDDNMDFDIRLLPSALNYGMIFGGNRITNVPGSGVGFEDGPGMSFCNYYDSNSGGNTVNDSLNFPLPILGTGADSNEADQGDTNQGYTDLTPGSQDFNLRSDATLRRTSISIPLI